MYPLAKCTGRTSSFPIPIRLSYRSVYVQEASATCADQRKQSSYQDDNDVHHTLAAGITSAAGLTIALPSRLWYTQTPDKPLAGLRLAVKDLYHLNGMKTSFGNRAMFEMSEPENTTAVAVQKLIDAGAVVVGKNKLSEFAYAGSYVVDHIDYLLPFNPRGDGYNSPGDSSGGSGSAVASYDWLDASMGSDTGGSIRGPALVNGVLGNRPSTGAVDLSGALPLSKAMDTSGLLVRDPMLWSRMNKVLYSGFGKEYPSLPKKVYVDPSLISDDPSYTTWWQQDVQPVIKAISAFLGTNVSSVSIDQIWNSTNHPGKLNRTEIANVVNVVYGNVNAYEQWTMFGRDYVNAWMETHDGEFPHMSPSTRRGWLAANTSITADMHQNYLDDMQIVRQWVADKFLKPDNDSCSDAIYLYFEPPFKQYKLDVSAATEDPYIEQLVEQATRLTIQVAELNATLLCDTTSASSNTTASTACREAQENFEALASGASDPVTVSPGRLASVAGLPDFAIAMGASPVFSNSTLKEEMVPWGMDIMAARGCDFMIQDLISALAQQGIVKTVKAGAQAF